MGEAASGGTDRDGACSAGTCSGTGQLREGLELDELRDLLWNYLAIDNYERLVLQQGWTAARYETWLASAISSAILGDLTRT